MEPARSPSLPCARSLLCGFAVLAVLALIAASQASAADPKAEYCARVAALPPRSADAHAELGEWCRQAGLEAEAAECFKKAIAIDADCEKARTALGYRRHGTGWRKEGEKASGFERPSRPGREAPPGPAPSGAVEPPSPPPAPAAPGAADPAGPAGSTSPEGSQASGGPSKPETAADSGASKPPGQGGEPGEVIVKKETPPSTPPQPGQPPSQPPAQPPATSKPSAQAQADAFAAEIEKKKAWAKAAAEKIQTTFNTAEEGDFLIHSTLPLSSREVRLLLGNLRILRKILASDIGVASNARIWPDKLQFVLLRSEPEYERFANMVDSIPSAKNPEGAYLSGGHAVLWNPESEALARTLGETALRRLNGSDRWVAWWLEQGVAELVYAQSPAGQKNEHFATTMKYAADVMKADGETLKIFNILETATYKDKDAARNRALAFSLVAFLMKKSSSGFHNLVKALKSDAAPAPPADSKSKEEFNAFHLSYISHQEKSLETCFGMNLSALQERWKAYTLQMAEALKTQDAAKEKEKTDAQKKADAQKKKGKGR